MSEDLIKTLEGFLEDGIGNTGELQYILRLLKEGKSLPRFDRKYLDNLLEKPSTKYRGANNYKSEGTALVLSLFFGLLGIMGVGHRYVGNIRRSLVILYVGWVLIIFSGLFSYFWIYPIIQKSIIPQLDQYYFPINLSENPNITGFVPTGSSTLALVFPAGYLAFFIWHIFDARNQSREFNKFMDEKGIPLYEVSIGSRLVWALWLAAPLIIISVLMILTLVLSKIQ